MKTQINQLVLGSKVVAGTNHSIREQIGQEVLAENGNTLTITWKGVELTLNFSASHSGKSWEYTGRISQNDAETLGLPFMTSKATEEFYSIQLSSKMFFTLYRFARRGNSPICKMREMSQLPTTDIVIL